MLCQYLYTILGQLNAEVKAKASVDGAYGRSGAQSSTLGGGEAEKSEERLVLRQTKANLCSDLCQTPNA